MLFSLACTSSLGAEKAIDLPPPRADGGRPLIQALRLRRSTREYADRQVLSYELRLLGWSQTKLARSAGIGLATLQRIEQSDGILKGNFATVLKIQRVLEGAGISFTDDAAGEIGVRLLKTKSRENTL